MAEKELLSLGTKFSFPPSEFPSVELATRCQFSAELAVKEAHRLGVLQERDLPDPDPGLSTTSALSKSLPPHLWSASRSLRMDKARISYGNKLQRGLG